MSSYEVELDFKELIYLLFKGKKCPHCNNKLKKMNKKEFLGEGLSSIRIGMSYVGKNYMIEIFYFCSSCKKVYNISELANITKTSN